MWNTLEKAAVGLPPRGYAPQLEDDDNDDNDGNDEDDDNSDYIE